MWGDRGRDPFVLKSLIVRPGQGRSNICDTNNICYFIELNSVSLVTKQTKPGMEWIENAT